MPSCSPCSRASSCSSSGCCEYHWDFDQLSAVFFIMGVVAGLLGGLRVNGTADAFVEGFRGMAFAALLIGFARGIYVVLDEGRVVDTIVHGLFSPDRRAARRPCRPSA